MEHKDVYKYKNVYKTTFLFGGIQVFNIIIKVLTNKIIALVLGSQGMGLIGVYNSVINTFRVGCGLGISQSAVREVSKANKENNDFSIVLMVTQRVIIFISLLGIIVTCLFSTYLSKWSFGNGRHILDFIYISLAVGLMIYSDGQIAILSGMRQPKILAKSNIQGAILGFLFSIPCLLLFRNNGIIPSLILSALSISLFSAHYVRKIKYVDIFLTIKQCFRNASFMIKMGIALAISSFVSNLATLVTVNYIHNNGSLQDVGFYNAGNLILVGYFTIIVTAITTDYFPRISAISNDNKEIQEELNRQTVVSMLLCFPILVLFLFLLPIFVQILYSKEFVSIVGFIKIGVFGSLVSICSRQMYLVLLAKRNIKTFVSLTFIYSIVELVLNIILYNHWKIIGIGISIMLLGIIQLLMMAIAVRTLYSIKLNKFSLIIFFTVIITLILACLVSYVKDDLTKFIGGTIIFISSCLFSYFVPKKYIGIDLLGILANKNN